MFFSLRFCPLSAPSPSPSPIYIQDSLHLLQKGCQIVIGTPGRVLEFLSPSSVPVLSSPSSSLSLSRPDVRELDFLILDEADRLLDMGFSIQISRILQILPKQRRTGLFSATQSHAIDDVIRTGMRNPVRVRVSQEKKKGGGGGGGERERALPSPSPSPVHSLPPTLLNRYIVCEQTQKLSLLLRLFSAHLSSKFIVYFMTCAEVDFYFRALLSCGVFGASLAPTSAPAMSKAKKRRLKRKREREKEKDQDLVKGGERKGEEGEGEGEGEGECEGQLFSFFSIHGRIPHPRRVEVFQKFTSLRTKIEDDPSVDPVESSMSLQTRGGGGALLTTDLAARGLDIPHIHYIVQFSPPQHSKTFIHRIGRTARAGEAGTAILLLNHEEADYLHFLEVQGVPISRLEMCDTKDEKGESGNVEGVRGGKEERRGSRGGGLFENSRGDPYQYGKRS